MSGPRRHSLRRTFKRIDKDGCGKISSADLVIELEFLGHKVKPEEVNKYIWEVDDDNDGVVDWEEFRSMFSRVRDDAPDGCEPRKLFNLVDFLLLDKNHTGSVDMDECLTLLWGRYGKELVEEKLRQMKAEDHASLRVDAANEKNVNFSFFLEIQRRCKKQLSGTAIKKGSTTVPTVKGLSFINDPAVAHLV